MGFEEWGDSINIIGEGRCVRIGEAGSEPTPPSKRKSEVPHQPTPSQPDPKPTPTIDDRSCGNICISQTWQLKDKSLEEACSTTQCTSYPYECPSGTNLCCPESVAEEWGKNIPMMNDGTCTRIGDGPEPPQQGHPDGSCGDTCIVQSWQLNGKSLEEVCSKTHCESVPYECQSGTKLCCPMSVAEQYGKSVRMINDGSCTRVDKELIAEG